MQCQRLLCRKKGGMRTSISLEHIAAFLSSRGGVMSPVALRCYDSAIPTPSRPDVARARRYFLGVTIPPRRLASAGAALFCTIVLVHIIPPNYLLASSSAPSSRRRSGGALFSRGAHSFWRDRERAGSGSAGTRGGGRGRTACRSRARGRRPLMPKFSPLKEDTSGFTRGLYPESRYQGSSPQC